MLVLHQGDEWTHDYGEAGHHNGRKLIDQRLSAARGHYDKRVFSGENSSERLPLAGPEIAMAKALGEQLTGCLFGYQSGHTAGYRHKVFRQSEFPVCPAWNATYVSTSIDVTERACPIPLSPPAHRDSSFSRPRLRDSSRSRPASSKQWERGVDRKSEESLSAAISIASMRRTSGSGRRAESS